MRKRVLLLVSALILVDQCAKWWVQRVLGGKALALTPGIVLWRTINRGVSFSLLSGSGPVGFWVLTSVILMLVGGLLWYTLRLYREKRPEAFGYALMFVGGSSNLLDRLWYGGVIDFIHCGIGQWHWPAFNLADVCVVSGALYVFGRLLRD